MIRTAFMAAVAAALVIVGTAASARDIGTPTGPVILTVTTADGASWTFDREMIEALGWETITTLTPFTEGPQQFAGIPMTALAEAVGASGDVVEAVAINDYVAELPSSHMTDHAVFLALDHGGAPMRVRDRGPVWIIYPSETIEAAANRFDRFMVWQVRELNFR